MQLMVFRISEILTKQGNSNKPLLNEYLTNPATNKRTTFSLSTSLNKKQQFWQWFKDQPELSSPVTIRVNDTIQQVEFLKADGTALGVQKRNEIRRFWQEQFMDERLKSIWFDAIMTGDGFGWKGFSSIEQIKQVVKEYSDKWSSRSNIDIKEVYDRLFIKAMDEDKRLPRRFDYVASSTMIINNDKTDVLNFQQVVNTNTVTYSTEEIIHFPFQRVDGKVAGHTPINSLAREMILLWFIKENMISYIRNGGIPNKIFTLPEEMPNSDNYKMLKQILTDFNAVESRNGNLVLTGKVDVQDLNEKLRDMEYKDLSLWVTSNIAYALQIPVQRIPYLIGSSQAGGDSGGLADGGYWSMIESDQRKIENLINTQLLKDRGVIMRFKKRYKLDDLRETQALTMKADGITKLQTIFNSYGKRLTPGKILSMMDMSESDVEEIKAEDMFMQQQQTGLMNQNMLNNNQLQGDQTKREGKKTEQINSANSAANVPGGQ